MAEAIKTTHKLFNDIAKSLDEEGFSPASPSDAELESVDVDRG